MEISKIIPFYRDLLVRTVPISNAPVSRCVLRSFFSRLAKELHLSSLRLFLLNDVSSGVNITHICGDKSLWIGFDISRLRKERAKYKHMFFVKIRHIKPNGQFALLGYLGFTSNEFVSNELIDSLEVLCLLYGNFIVKKVVHSQNEYSHSFLLHLYRMLAKNELPGTKILETLKIFQALTKAYKCYYFTVNRCLIYPEYIADRGRGTYFRKNRGMVVCNSFIEKLITSKSYEVFQLVEIPMVIQNFILYHKNRKANELICQIYPVFVDAEFVGLWMFVYSKTTPYEYYDINRLINDTYVFNKQNYKFLFQRRFSKMIIDPIFKNRDTRINDKDVFVIMPFTEIWSNDVWEQAISISIKEMGMNPVRADNLYGANIMEDIWTSILKAAIVICDTTNRNPNVFYELGLAHTLGKKVILLTQNVNDIPFDLQAYRHIVYTTTMTGGNKLKEDIKKYVGEYLKDEKDRI